MSLMFKLLVAWQVLGCTLVTQALESNKNNAVANPTERYTMSSGLQLAFTHSPALDVLKQWSLELDNPDKFPELNYQLAVKRELEVVKYIDSGLWPQEVYTEYQKMVATTGNVDSAGLLVRYGVASIVENTVAMTTQNGRFHHSAMYCKGEEFLELFDAGVDLDIGAQDGASTPLITASFAGCLPIVGMLISEGVDINAMGQHGMTALMVAAAVGNLEVVETLLEGGADVHVTHKFAGSTALHFAAEMNHAKVVQALCAAGAHVNAVNSVGIKPIHIAAHSGANASITALVRSCRAEVDAVIYVPKYQKDRNQRSGFDNPTGARSASVDAFGDNSHATPLYLAAQAGQLAAVTALLRLGANVHVLVPVEAVQEMVETHGLDQDADAIRRLDAPVDSAATASAAGTESDSFSGSTGDFEEPVRTNVYTGYHAQPVHIAAEHGHSEVVAELLNHGADVDSMSMGLTPLHLTALKNKPETMKVLLAANANVDAISELDGSTALFSASGAGFDVIVKLLLKYKASTSIVNSHSGSFPLLHASMYNKMHVVRLLLHEGKADPDQATADGWRCVHIAAMHGHLATFNALSVHSADLFAAGPDGMTAIHFAAMNGHESVLVELIHLIKQNFDRRRPRGARGSLDQARISDGSTALHMVSRKGDYLMCRRLLKAGADFNAKMRSDVAYGATALYLAAQSGNTFVVRELLKAGANPDAQLDRIGSTALLTSIERGDIAMVRVLVDGVPLDSTYSQATLVASTAKKVVVNSIDDDDDDDDDEQNEEDVVVTANVNLGVSAHETSKSPLVLAVVHDFVEIAEALLDSGADCTTKFLLPPSTQPSQEIILEGGSKVAEDVNPVLHTELSLKDVAVMKKSEAMLELLNRHEACQAIYISSENSHGDEF